MNNQKRFKLRDWFLGSFSGNAIIQPNDVHLIYRRDEIPYMDTFIALLIAYEFDVTNLEIKIVANDVHLIYRRDEIPYIDVILDRVFSQNLFTNHQVSSFFKFMFDPNDVSADEVRDILMIADYMGAIHQGTMAKFIALLLAHEFDATNLEYILQNIFNCMPCFQLAKFDLPYLCTKETMPTNVAAKNAVSAGHLKCVKFFNEAQNLPENVLSIVVNYKHLECLTYLMEQGTTFNFSSEKGLILFDNAIEMIAEAGLLELLKYLSEARGYYLPSSAAYSAAEAGQLECLKYLYKPDMEIDEALVSAAASRGHLDCVKFLVDNGCETSWITGYNTALHGQLECLKYIFEKNVKCISEDACHGAVENGHLHCLKFLHQNGCGWDKHTTRVAAMKGELECLKYLYENGCEWDYLAVEGATEYGHLKCLQYLIERGCTSRSRAAMLAAMGGHIKCLYYLYSIGCIWTPTTADLEDAYFVSTLRLKVKHLDLHVGFTTTCRIECLQTLLAMYISPSEVEFIMQLLNKIQK